MPPTTGTPKGAFIWFFFIPMVLAVGFCLFFLIKNLYVMVKFTRTTGKIVRYDDSKTSGGQTLYRTIVAYKTPDNVEHEAGSLTRSSSAYGKIGDTVTVYYDPQHLDKAAVHTFRDTWLHVLVLGIVGSILFIVWYGALMGVTASDPPPGYTGAVRETYNGEE